MRLKTKFMVAGYCRHPEAITVKGGEWKVKSFPAIFTLISHPKLGYILFDTGYSTCFYLETKKFPFKLYRWVTEVYVEKNDLAVSQLKDLNILPEEIKYIIISHFHADHIGGLRDFPNAKFICFKSYYKKIKKLKSFKALKKGFLSKLLPDDFEKRILDIEKTKKIKLSDNLYPFTSGFDIFNDSSIKAINLSGHVKNQIGIFFKNERSKNIFLIGDASWSTKAYKKFILPSFLAYFVIEDIKGYKNTLYRLHQLHCLNPDFIMIPSHCREVWESIKGKIL